MVWQKGKSGNPGGRPKEVAEVSALARQYGPEAVERLAAIMRSDDLKAARGAADSLLDRGYGRPVQSVEQISAVVNLPADALSDEQLERIARGANG